MSSPGLWAKSGGGNGCSMGGRRCGSKRIALGSVAQGMEARQRQFKRRRCLRSTRGAARWLERQFPLWSGSPEFQNRGGETSGAAWEVERAPAREKWGEGGPREVGWRSSGGAASLGAKPATVAHTGGEGAAPLFQTERGGRRYCGWTWL